LAASTLSVLGNVLYGGAGISVQSPSQLYIGGKLISTGNAAFIAGGPSSSVFFQNGIDHNSTGIFQLNGNTYFTTNNQTVSGIGTAEKITSNLTSIVGIKVTNKLTYWQFNASVTGTDANSTLENEKDLYFNFPEEPMLVGKLVSTIPGSTGSFIAYNSASPQVIKAGSYNKVSFVNIGEKTLIGDLSLGEIGIQCPFTFGNGPAINLSVSGLTAIFSPVTMTGAAHRFSLGGGINSVPGANIIATSGTVNYAASTPQTILSGTYNDIEISGGTKTLSANTGVNALSMNGAVLDLGAYNLSVSGNLASINPLVPFSNTNKVINSGIGNLVRDRNTAIGFTKFVFPVGTNVAFVPVTILGYGGSINSDNSLSVRVDDFTGSTDYVPFKITIASGANTATGMNDFKFQFQSPTVIGSPLIVLDGSTDISTNSTIDNLARIYSSTFAGAGFSYNSTKEFTVNGVPIPSITGISLSGNNLCVGNQYIVSIFGTSLFTNGNLFTLEISDSNGNFPGTTIQSWLDTNPNTVFGISIPMLTSGNSYKLRATATNTVANFISNQNITVNGVPTITNIAPLNVFWNDEITFTGTNMLGLTDVILSNGSTINGFNTITGTLATQTVATNYVNTNPDIGPIKLVNACGTSAFSLQVLTAWPVHATNVSITGNGGTTLISTSGGNLQINFDVLPNTPFSAGDLVTWQLIPANGLASISGSGLLQALGDGTVTVIGVSVSDPTVTGIFVITIVGQSPQIITTSSATPTSVCHGQALSISFTKSGAFPGGLFVAEIYNAVTTIQLGSVLGVQPIPVTIPGSVIGNDFRIRVRHNIASGAFAGDNGTNITVGGIPTVTGVPTQNICTGATTDIPLSSTPSASSFTWLISSADVGITGAGAGIGTNISQTLGGTGTVVYSVTANNGCVSQPVNITININDVPSVNNPGIQGVCSGGTTSVALSSPVTSSNFSWTVFSTTGTAIGASGGTGNTISQVLNGNGSVFYNVFAFANGCTSSGYNLEVGVSAAPNSTLGVNAVTTNLCANEDGLISVQNSEIGINYNTLSNSFPSANQLQGTGTTITLTIPSADLTAGSNTIAIRATSSGCGTRTLAGTALVNKGTGPDITKTISVANPNVCQGSSGIVTVNAAENGVIYAPFIGNLQIGNTVSGTNANLNISVETRLLALGNQNISLKALSVGCSNFVTLANTAALTINAVPTVNTNLQQTICAGTSTNIVLNSTPAGAAFSWIIGNVTGNPTGQSSGSGTTIAQLLNGKGRVEYLVTPTLGFCSGQVASLIVNITGVPSTTLPVIADSICGGQTATISIRDSEIGVEYILSKNSNFVTSGLGTGNALSLTVPDANLALGSNSFELLASGCINQTFAPNPNIVMLNAPGVPDVSITKVAGAECDKLNTTLSVIPGYVNYQWRMNGIKIAGANANSYTPVTNGQYAAEIFVGNKCSVISNTLTVDITSSLSKPIISSYGGIKDTLLESSEARTYQWYVGKRAIVNATNKKYRPLFLASYRVRVNVAETCAQFSDEYSLNNSDFDELTRYNFEMTDSTIVIDENKIKPAIAEVELSPNPAFESFTISYVSKSKNKAIYMSIYNSFGQMVFSQVLKTNHFGQIKHEMHRKGLSSGMYKIVLLDGDNKASASLVLE
jgi:hypothetical protein